MCVNKERFRSRFHLWPKAKKWKEAREDLVTVYTHNIVSSVIQTDIEIR